MNDKISVTIILIIMLLVAITGICLSPKNKNISAHIEQTYKQTETNKLNYNALSSMINVQNARLIKKNIELESKIQQLQNNLENNDSQIFQLQTNEAENFKILQEVVRIQELVINQEEKIYNLEEKNRILEKKFETSNILVNAITIVLDQINTEIFNLKNRDNIFQSKFEEICKYLKYLSEKPKIDIRYYKFYKPGCN